MTRQEQNENDHFFSFFELSEEFPSLALFFFFPVDEPEPELLPTDFDFTFLVTLHTEQENYFSKTQVT